MHVVPEKEGDDPAISRRGRKSSRHRPPPRADEHRDLKRKHQQCCPSSSDGGEHVECLPPPRERGRHGLFDECAWFDTTAVGAGRVAGWIPGWGPAPDSLFPVRVRCWPKLRGDSVTSGPAPSTPWPRPAKLGGVAASKRKCCSRREDGSAKRESATRESAKRESAKRESAKRESAKRESAKRESAKRKSAKCPLLRGSTSRAQTEFWAGGAHHISRQVQGVRIRRPIGTATRGGTHSTYTQQCTQQYTQR